MEPVNNNLFEVKPTSKSKRKIIQPCPTAYLNPALDLLANEDPMCNTAMEIPVKKRKRTRSLEIAAFENSALDLGISKAAVNEFLVRELENVKKNLKSLDSPLKTATLAKDETKVKPILKTFQKLPELPKKFTQNCMNNEKTSISLPDISITENLTILNNITQLLETDVDAINNTIDSDPNLTQLVDKIDMVPVTHVTEPIYANLTDINTNIKKETDYRTNNDIEESLIEDTTLDNTNNNQSMDISNIVPIVNDTNMTEPVITECMKISNNKNEIDSGISVIEHKSIVPTNELQNTDLSAINNITNIQTNVSNQVFINNPNLSLSFIDRLALESPNMSNQSLYLDDDLNESNIMEIKTITIITTKKRVPKKNTNPFLDPNFNDDVVVSEQNPFLNIEPVNNEMEYNEEMLSRPVQPQNVEPNNIMPRRLFTSDNNSTVSTVNESNATEIHEYENIDVYRSDSPTYENVCEDDGYYNKQSKILGHDVSKFSAIDIMNLNKNSQANSSNESAESKKDLKNIFKAGKKVFKTLKKKFKHDKSDENKATFTDNNVTLNPYEVPRKPPKQKVENKDSGIANPGLNLDNSDEIEIEELEDEEHQYETIKTIRNTRLNMNVTPLKDRGNENADVSHNRTNTPNKKVRFDSTLNQEKVITGNSFDYGIQSPGFDAKIDKYHDELENCINERKFLQQNM